MVVGWGLRVRFWGGGSEGSKGGPGRFWSLLVTYTYGLIFFCVDCFFSRLLEEIKEEA